MQKKQTITKEEINKLPLLNFSGDIKIITSESDAKKALKKLSKEKILGFDTETRPSFKKGETYPVSLIQLSTQKTAYLFRIHLFPFPEELGALLSNKDIVKTGVAVQDDIKDLQKLCKFKAENFVDLAPLAKKRGFSQFGLRSLTALILKMRLSKRAKLTNWENKTLTQAQLEYAAIDAWVGLKLYKELA